MPGASPELRDAWRRLAKEEEFHLQLLLARMEELGVRVDARAVSDRLWRRLSRCRDAAEFSVQMREAESRGQAAEESFRRSLADKDPVTAAIFGRIADDEAEHLALADRFAAAAQSAAVREPFENEKIEPEK